ncbi:MAG: LytTR family DNA-binding domain-containing protein [Oscillospiraceae bacterium]
MKFEIIQDDTFDNTEVIIKCKTIDNETENLIKFLESKLSNINGKLNNKTFILSFDEIFYFDSVDNKTFAYCENEVYDIEEKLYKLESILENHNYFRCSKSTIVNLNKIKSFRPMFNSRIEIELNNGESLIVNRKYIKILREKLGLD